MAGPRCVRPCRIHHPAWTQRQTDHEWWGMMIVAGATDLEWHSLLKQINALFVDTEA